MSQLERVKLNCMRALNDGIGLTALTPYWDSIEVLDFEVVGENKTLHTATFRVKPCDLLEYHANFLTGDFRITHTKYKGEFIIQ